MGIVYEAQDIRTGRRCVLKRMNSQDVSAADLARFEREALSLSALSHPNIVKVLDFVRSPVSPVMVMEWLDGQTLEKAASGLTVRERQLRARSWLAPIASALAEMHRRGLVHRDLKPSNIFIESGSGRAVLIDFGLARVADEARRSADLGEGLSLLEATITAADEVAGTPAAMAPEQLDRSLGAIGPASDSWGLGVCLYWLIEGRMPFQGSPVQVIRAIVTGERPLISPDLPAELSGLIRACFRAQAELRPSCAEIAGLLSRLPEFAPVRAKRRSNLSLGLAGLILSFLVLSLWFFGDFRRSESVEQGPEPKVISPVSLTIESAPNFTSLLELPLRGAYRPAAILRINGQVIRCSSEGVFQFFLPLKRGQNNINVQIVELESELAEAGVLLFDHRIEIESCSVVRTLYPDGRVTELSHLGTALTQAPPGARLTLGDGVWDLGEYEIRTPLSIEGTGQSEIPSVLRVGSLLLKSSVKLSRLRFEAQLVGQPVVRIESRGVLLEDCHFQGRREDSASLYNPTAVRGAGHMGVEVVLSAGGLAEAPALVRCSFEGFDGAAILARSDVEIRELSVRRGAAGVLVSDGATARIEAARFEELASNAIDTHRSRLFVTDFWARRVYRAIRVREPLSCDLRKIQVDTTRLTAISIIAEKAETSSEDLRVSEAKIDKAIQMDMAGTRLSGAVCIDGPLRVALSDLHVTNSKVCGISATRGAELELRGVVTERCGHLDVVAHGGAKVSYDAACRFQREPLAKSTEALKSQVAPMR